MSKQRAWENPEGAVSWKGTPPSLLPGCEDKMKVGLSQAQARGGRPLAAKAPPPLTSAQSLLLFPSSASLRVPSQPES